MHVHESAESAAVLKGYDTWNFRKQSVIPSNSDVEAWPDARPPLPQDD